MRNNLHHDSGDAAVLLFALLVGVVTVVTILAAAADTDAAAAANVVWEKTTTTMMTAGYVVPKVEFFCYKLVVSVCHVAAASQVASMTRPVVMVPRHGFCAAMAISSSVCCNKSVFSLATQQASPQAALQLLLLHEALVVHVIMIALQQQNQRGSSCETEAA